MNQDSIVYRASHAAIDLTQLAALFVSAGWHWRAADPQKLAALVEGSRYVVSAHDEAAGSRLIGFARAISDGVTNAYVGNVSVLPTYRRRGIGAELVRHLLEGKDAIRFVLHAGEGLEDFYRKLGFEDATRILWRDRRS